jgi:hypothetical protein
MARKKNDGNLKLLDQQPEANGEHVEGPTTSNTDTTTTASEAEILQPTPAAPLASTWPM